ncbi:DUF1616 domain-containing protein [Natronorubrum daqingense]|uniref:Uncharacterized membrane protein n=1 Tax=Natronorubrum daqingense TaxID=588898 RepID=A0A1N6YJL9_9EURY|nr:DUF1616 domain-containing protein [Natronorubrum daqingense]APX95644.1 hypothetical protein BB347_02900 [Natronorubrum daqingense]SIR14778.1 Uncharacterized membrane protein [Natronorubrum daqingense]
MSDSHWWYSDLAAVIAITGISTFAVFYGVGTIARTLLLMPLILFIPGYALVSVMFPDNPTDEYQSFDDEKSRFGTPLVVTGGIESVERFVLSVVFSVALVPSIAILASATPGGLTLETVLSGIALLTIVLSLLAIVARYRCPAERRFVPSLSSGIFYRTQTRDQPGFQTRSQPNPHLFNVAIVIGLVLLLATGGFAIANPPQHDGFTEFSIETENVTGETETMYESSYAAGENETLTTTITNEEHEEHTYTTVALLEDVSYDDDGEASVEEAEELDRESTTVADGETVEQDLEIVPSMQGEDLRITLLLYTEEPPSDPTTENADEAIHLPIEVE